MGMKVEELGQVLVVTLCNPAKHNAYTAGMLQQLRATFGEVRDNRAIRCVVIQGEGRSFSSGSDLTEVRAVSPAEAAARTHLDFSTKQAIFECPKITIAAVHGYCLGGGLELATACDLRIASADAKFGLPEMDVGSLPGSGGIQRLMAIVGRGRALDWILTSRRFDAQEALAAGLVTEVVATDRLGTRAIELANKLAPRNEMAVELAKALLDPSSVRSGAFDETVHALAASNLRYAGLIARS